MSKSPHIIRNPSRRQFLKASGAAGVSLAIPIIGSAEKAQPRKPNIIFILADDLGYGDLGCFGQKQVHTPNLDRMAAEGIRMTQHYAGSTVCAPSRCCLVTGLHTGHCYVRGNARLNLRPDDQTVAKMLKKAGYSTGLVGKWGLGQEGSKGIPNEQGFDFFFGYLNQHHAHNYYPTFLVRNRERIKLLNEVPRQGRWGQGRATKKFDYSHDMMTAEALSFIDKNSKRPFFLYLAYTIPHANNEAGRTGMEVPDYGIYADKDWPEPQKGFAAMVTRMDRDIGSLMARLKEHGIDEDTLLIFSSDNGPHREGGNNPNYFDSNGPLRGIKRDLYEGGIRVPTIARWPGRIKPGTTTDHISAFWDFLPTAAEAAGLEPPQNTDGISFLPALLGKEQRSHDYLYWEFFEGGGKKAVRMGDWKGVQLNLHRTPNSPIQLYNLKDDIGEKKNVAGQHPDVVTKIGNIMKTARTKSKRWRFAPAKKKSAKKKA